MSMSCMFALGVKTAAWWDPRTRGQSQEDLWAELEAANNFDPSILEEGIRQDDRNYYAKLPVEARTGQIARQFEGNPELQQTLATLKPQSRPATPMELQQSARQMANANRNPVSRPPVQPLPAMAQAPRPAAPAVAQAPQATPQPPVQTATSTPVPSSANTQAYDAAMAAIPKRDVPVLGSADAPAPTQAPQVASRAPVQSARRTGIYTKGKQWVNPNDAKRAMFNLGVTAAS